jgi:NDP-sugar pyrophosphorylase family protein
MKRAIILAGGRGTRLRPYTISLPKPLMPVGDSPILEIIIRQLASHGFDHVTLAVNHQADILRAYFGDGSKWGIHIDYSLEHKPLNTVGPLRLIKNLPENFLVMNGDILTDLDFAEFFQRHEAENRLFTISAAQREQSIDYGVLTSSPDQSLVGFEEKPKIPYLVSMGIYCVNHKVIEAIPDNEPYGFDQLMIKFLKEKKIIKIMPHTGYWLDIGRPDDYEKAIDDWPILSQNL